MKMNVVNQCIYMIQILFFFFFSSCSKNFMMQHLKDQRFLSHSSNVICHWKLQVVLIMKSEQTKLTTQWPETSNNFVTLSVLVHHLLETLVCLNSCCNCEAKKTKPKSGVCARQYIQDRCVFIDFIKSQVSKSLFLLFTAFLIWNKERQIVLHTSR